ncbi:hypothetical protein [Paenibacillus oralis]|uniref:hypothetical protein n=1 Tax=Paenibacillus oralis TaxID=2490856 RepID=UPI001FE6C941|nr:hypothetical protein [Paenibacillus oralis]
MPDAAEASPVRKTAPHHPAAHPNQSGGRCQPEQPPLPEYDPQERQTGQQTCGGQAADQAAQLFSRSVERGERRLG